MPSDERTEEAGDEQAEEAPRPLLVTVSPHIRSPESIPRIMWTVSAALLPAMGWAVYVFGPRALWTTALGIVSAVATEAALQALRRRPISIRDGSAFLTGVLVAFVLPVQVPWYVPVAASVFAIGVVKQAFGGLGCNIWNPALMGRAFVLAAWTALVTVGGGWPAPFAYRSGAGRQAGDPDAVTAATPLTGAKEASREFNKRVRKIVLGFDREVAKGRLVPRTLEKAREELRKRGEVATPTSHAEAREAIGRIREEVGVPLDDLFLGRVGGCIGEVSALALLVGGVVLIALGYVRWQVPVFYIGTVALLAWLLPVTVQGAKLVHHAGEGLYFAQETTYFVAGRPLFHVFAGGLFLGAFFMATDMVTSPVTAKGLIVFAIGCGILTMVIRRYGGYPEGVCYAILLMNTATPLIDRYTKPKVFGRRPKQ